MATNYLGMGKDHLVWFKIINLGRNRANKMIQ